MSHVPMTWPLQSLPERTRGYPALRNPSPCGSEFAHSSKSELSRLSEGVYTRPARDFIIIDDLPVDPGPRAPRSSSFSLGKTKGHDESHERARKLLHTGAPFHLSPRTPCGMTRKARDRFPPRLPSSRNAPRQKRRYTPCLGHHATHPSCTFMLLIPHAPVFWTGLSRVSPEAKTTPENTPLYSEPLRCASVKPGDGTRYCHGTTTASVGPAVNVSGKGPEEDKPGVRRGLHPARFRRVPDVSSNTVYVTNYSVAEGSAFDGRDRWQCTTLYVCDPTASYARL